MISGRKVLRVALATGMLAMGGVASMATAASAAPPQVCDGTTHADTGHGANVSGAYNANCQGQPSMNGNGNGNATGRPCAGCVGNADDMNPRGQMPDGTDHNNGYECDGNKGIGRTNPAHTGCGYVT